MDRYLLTGMRMERLTFLRTFCTLLMASLSSTLLAQTPAPAVPPALNRQVDCPDILVGQGTSVRSLLKLKPTQSVPSDASTCYVDQDPVFRAYYQSPEIDSHLLLDRQRDHIIASFSGGDSSAGIYYKNGGTQNQSDEPRNRSKRPIPNASADEQSAHARDTFGVETTTREFVITTVLLGGMRFQRDFREFQHSEACGLSKRLSRFRRMVASSLRHRTDRQHSYAMTIRSNCTLQLSGKTVPNPGSGEVHSECVDE